MKSTRKTREKFGGAGRAGSGAPEPRRRAAVGSLGPVALTGLQEPGVTQPDELLEANLRPRWCLLPVRRLLPGARALGWRRVPHGPEPALARLQGPLAAAEVALLRGRAVVRGVADLHALALRRFHLEQAGLSGFGRPAYVSSNFYSNFSIWLTFGKL